MKADAIRTADGGRRCFGRTWPWVLMLALTADLPAPANGAPLQLLTVPDPAQPPPAGGGGDSLAPILSPDGRYVLFASHANNLVAAGNGLPIPAGFPSKLNVYLRDRTNLTTVLVSVNLTGIAGGNENSLPTGLCADGRQALFESSASDLVPGDANGAADVFVRDLAAGTTTLVSVSTNGGPPNGASRGSVITPDGRCVAFVSQASNLVPEDTNGIADVFVRDLQTGVTTLVSVGAQGLGVNSSEFPDITPDGRYVAFYSTATGLVPDTVNTGDIYVRDLNMGTTTWASRDALAAVQAAMPATAVAACNHTLSTNGQYVAFEAAPFSMPLSSAGVILRYNVFSGVTDVVHTNATTSSGPLENVRTLDMTPDGSVVTFVANDTNTSPADSSCVYVWDGASGSTMLASGDLSNNVPAHSTCDWPRLDASGRYVCFVSTATNLVTNLLAGDLHAYVRDLQAGVTTLVDADTNGAGSALSLASAPQISADGRIVVFESPDGGLVPNDSNRDYDVLARDLGSGTTELVSARDETLPTVTPRGPSSISAYSVSSNGQYVAFASDADDLVPGDTNACTDIFVHDAVLGTNVLASVATNGASADGPSSEPAISGNGRYVAFTSSADNLVAGDTNNTQDVFVRELQTGVTRLISVSMTGAGSGNGASHSPQISADGRYVMFLSLATNLTSASFYPGYDIVYVRDLQADTTYALGQAYYSSSAAADMTPDGRFVAFYGKLPQSSSLRLYVWGNQSATLIYTNSSPYGVYFKLAISPDGNRIAYATNDTSFTTGVVAAVDRVSSAAWTIGSLVPNLHAGLRFSGDGRFLAYATKIARTNQVYLYDLQYSTNFLVSRAYDSAASACGDSDWPEISSDGRFIAYRSAAANIAPGDTNGQPDLFLYDRVTQSTTCLTANRFGTSLGNNRSLAPVFSGDGQTLVFESWASDLTAQDFNQGSDLFACQLSASGQIPTFSVTLMSGGPGQGPWLMWPVVPGRSYGVEFKNTLDDPEWHPLNQGATIVGTQGYLKDFSGGAAPRFYRVVAY